MATTVKVKAHKVRATLRDRKRCYNGHRLSDENVDRYGKGGYRKSERTQPGQAKWIGCRLCRRDARTRWRVKNAQAIVNARNAERKAAKAALAAARPSAKGKAA